MRIFQLFSFIRQLNRLTVISNSSTNVLLREIIQSTPQNCDNQEKSIMTQSDRSFVKFIEQNPALHEFFNTFSKQLMILTLQRKVAKFSRNDVLLNFDLLEKYLMSDESIFEVKNLHDFLHCMSVLGFHRYPSPEKPEKRFLCYRFVNPNFNEFGAIPDDLYKIPFNPFFSSMKQKKQVLSTHTVEFLQRLVSIVIKQKITNLELAQMKLQFSLQKKLETIRDQTIEIEFVFDEPDYSQNNEIAGYYGNVPLDLLREAFGDYFPIYQNGEAQLPDSIDVDEKPPSTLMECPETSMLAETIKTESSSTPVIVYESAMDEVAENVDITTARKKRRTLKPQSDVSTKEMEDALKFLHKDSFKMEREQLFD